MNRKQSIEYLNTILKGEYIWYEIIEGDVLESYFNSTHIKEITHSLDIEKIPYLTKEGQSYSYPQTKISINIEDLIEHKAQIRNDKIN
jgi:hypothetical protein